MDYELYHDESLISGYWHGILLVPNSTKRILVDLLESARRNTGYQHPLSLKNIRRKGIIYCCAYAWITLGVAALASRFKNDPPQIFLGNKYRGNFLYSRIEHLIGAKFILFTEKDCHRTMNNYPDYGSKVETTFRMGLKGGLHYLGEDENPINITRMHFDGHKHYFRNIDQERIVNRLHGLKPYCSIENNDDLIDDRGSNNNRPGDCQSYEDCQLLQLTDLLVGSFRTFLGETTNQVHKELGYPIVPIMKRLKQGYARMRNSRWWNSICMSRCNLENGRWNFDTLYFENNPTDYQLRLSDLKE